MPGANGFEVLQALNKIEDELQIPAEQRAKAIMITSLDDPESFITAIEEGSHWYITKPVNRAALLKVIEDLGL